MSAYIPITNPEKVKFKEEEEEMEQVKTTSYDEANKLKEAINKYIDAKLKKKNKNLHYLNHVLRNFCIKIMLDKHSNNLNSTTTNNMLNEFINKVNEHYKDILTKPIMLTKDTRPGLLTQISNMTIDISHGKLQNNAFINYALNEVYSSIKGQIKKNINKDSDKYKRANEELINYTNSQDKHDVAHNKEKKKPSKENKPNDDYLSYLDATPVNDKKEIDNDNLDTIGAEEEQAPEEPKPKINDSRDDTKATNVKLQDETDTSDIKKRVSKLVDDTQSEAFKEPEHEPKHEEEEQTPEHEDNEDNEEEQTPEQEEQTPEHEEEVPEQEQEKWPRTMYKHFNNMFDELKDSKKLGNALYIYTDFCDGIINEIRNVNTGEMNQDIARAILDYVNLFNSAVFGPDGKWNNGFNNGKILNIITNKETIRDGVIKNRTRLSFMRSDGKDYKDMSWLQLKHLIQTVVAESNQLANKYNLPLLKTITFSEVLNKNIIGYNSLKNNEANQYGYIDTDNVYGITEMLRNNEVLQGLINKGIITKDGYGNYTYDNEPINISELTNIITKARLQDILTRSRGSLTEMQRNNKAVYQTVSKALQRRRKMFIHINKSAEPTINKLDKEKQNGVIINGKYKLNPMLLRNNLK